MHLADKLTGASGEGSGMGREIVLELLRRRSRVAAAMTLLTEGLHSELAGTSVRAACDTDDGPSQSPTMEQ